MRGGGGSALVYLSDPRGAWKGSTTPCRTSRSRVDPSRRRAAAQLVPERKRNATRKRRRRLLLVWLAVLPCAAFRLRRAGMEPPRSQPLLESVERMPVLFLPAGGTCFGFLSAFFLRLYPDSWHPKMTKNLPMTNFFFFLSFLGPTSPLFCIANRSLVMLYGCQKGAPVTFTCRAPKVDQPRACPVNTLPPPPSPTPPKNKNKTCSFQSASHRKSYQQSDLVFRLKRFLLLSNPCEGLSVGNGGQIGFGLGNN